MMLQPIIASLKIIKQFPPNLVEYIRYSDWQMLAECPGRQRWRELFYPYPEGSRDGQRKRHKSLLSHVNDSVYKDILQLIEDCYESGLVTEFPNIATFMKMTNAEGDALAAVMTHIVEWLNPTPTVIVNRRRIDKPQLWQDLVPAVSEYLSKCYDYREDYTDEMISQSCRIVEDAVVRVARRHMSFFTKPDGKATLKTHMENDPSYYGQRFRQHKPWNDLYTTVNELFYHHSPLQWSRDETTVARVHDDQRITTTARALTDILHKADWITENSVLNTAEASYILAHEIRSQLYKWAIEMHNKAGQPYGDASEDTAARMRESSKRTMIWDIKAYLDEAELQKQGQQQDIVDTRKRKEQADSQLVQPTSKTSRRYTMQRQESTTTVYDISTTVIEGLGETSLLRDGELHSPSLPTRALSSGSQRERSVPPSCSSDENMRETNDERRPSEPSEETEATRTVITETVEQESIGQQNPTPQRRKSGQDSMHKDYTSKTLPQAPITIERGADRSSRGQSNKRRDISTPASLFPSSAAKPQNHTPIHTIQAINRTTLPSQKNDNVEREETLSFTPQPTQQSRWANKAGAKTGGQIVRRR